jgi:2-amino-4-hydroxy-6-hydroxymethyldihydropteridine diphosphokinase
MRHLAYLSLGSNLGDRKGHLRAAIAHLKASGHIVSVSSFYETEPLEVTDQPWFLNCAVALETAESPAELMTAILRIQQQMDRKLIQRKGPRIIDIDILLFDDTILDSPALTIPHPAMHERRFVLQPLAEIAPQAKHPLLNKTIQRLLDSLPPGQQVREYEVS